MSKDSVIRQYPYQRNKFLAILFPGKHTADIIPRIYFAIYQLTELLRINIFRDFTFCMPLLQSR